MVKNGIKVNNEKKSTTAAKDGGVLSYTKIVLENYLFV
jgi:hypothetical protein